MKLLLSLVGAIALTTSPASAAIVNYSMVFKDLAGVEVGTGSFSFDPVVKTDIIVGDDNTPCPPFIPTPEAPCVLLASWTPLTSFSATIAGVTFPYTPPPPGKFFIGSLFLEGTFVFDPRCTVCDPLRPDEWLAGDILDEELAVLTIFGLNLSPTSVHRFGTVDDEGGGVSGTVEFTRLPPIPLPAGGILFLSALGAFAALRRR